MEGTSRQYDQFETLAALREYANNLLRVSTNDHGGIDIRPSIAGEIVRIVSRMHNIKDRLETKS